MSFINLLSLVIGIYALYRLLRWARTKQKRYIPIEVKRAVLKRYFGMCAVCDQSDLLEYHHKKPYAFGGDNSEKNITPLCPKHHSMVRRMENDTLPK